MTTEKQPKAGQRVEVWTDAGEKVFEGVVKEVKAYPDKFQPVEITISEDAEQSDTAMTYFSSTPSLVIAADTQSARIVPHVLRSARHASGMTQRPNVPMGWPALPVVAGLTQALRRVWHRCCAAMRAVVVAACPAAQRVRQRGVFRMTHNYEILRTIVRPASPAHVTVVNVLVRSQPATKHLFRNKAMLGDTPAYVCVGMVGCPNPYVTVRTQRSRLTRHTRDRTVSPLAGLAGRNAICNAARLAGKIDGHRDSSSRCRPGRVLSAPGFMLPSILLLGRAA